MKKIIISFLPLALTLCSASIESEETEEPKHIYDVYLYNIEYDSETYIDLDGGAILADDLLIGGEVCTGIPKCVLLPYVLFHPKYVDQFRSVYGEETVSVEERGWGGKVIKTELNDRCTIAVFSVDNSLTGVADCSHKNDEGEGELHQVFVLEAQFD